MFVALVAVAVLLAACGGGDDSGDRDPSRQVVNASDFEFDRERVEVVAGLPTSVELLNRGSLEHTWTVLRAGASPTTAEDVGDGDVLFSLEADSSQSSSGLFTPPDPGVYRIVCLVPGHLEAGMAAELVSVAPGG